MGGADDPALVDEYSGNLWRDHAIAQVEKTSSFISSARRQVILTSVRRDRDDSQSRAEPIHTGRLIDD